MNRALAPQLSPDLNELGALASCCFIVAQVVALRAEGDDRFNSRHLLCLILKSLGEFVGGHRTCTHWQEGNELRAVKNHFSP